MAVLNIGGRIHNPQIYLDGMADVCCRDPTGGGRGVYCSPGSCFGEWSNTLLYSSAELQVQKIRIQIALDKIRCIPDTSMNAEDYPP